MENITEAHVPPEGNKNNNRSRKKRKKDTNNSSITIPEQLDTQSSFEDALEKSINEADSSKAGAHKANNNTTSKAKKISKFTNQPDIVKSNQDDNQVDEVQLRALSPVIVSSTDNDGTDKTDTLVSVSQSLQSVVENDDIETETIGLRCLYPGCTYKMKRTSVRSTAIFLRIKRSFTGFIGLAYAETYGDSHFEICLRPSRLRVLLIIE